MNSGPLSGRRVVVTRPPSQAEALVNALESQGAQTVVVPVIAIEDPEDGGAALRAGLAALRSGDWLIVTSPNGATRVGSVIAESPVADGVKVAAIGPGTSRSANEVGLDVDLVPGHSIAEGLLEAFPEPPSHGGLVMLARAETARDVLPDGLVAKGWIVDDVVAYRTVAVPVGESDRIACREADAVAFTSSSTVNSLFEAVGADGMPPKVVSIGPATSAAARDIGLRVDAEADPHTIPGLVQALVSCFSDRSGSQSDPERSEKQETRGVVSEIGDGQLEALIFDFDGTMVDTEWPVFEMVRGVYRAHGVELVIADWVDKLGRTDHQPWPEELAEVIGREPDTDVVDQAIAEGRQQRSTLLLLPGVADLMERADRAGVPMAVASSSPLSWVEGHLERLGILGRFEAILTCDDVEHTKPHPDLFLAAAAALDVDPSAIIAIEDSRHGCRAAKSAGMTCVVVPNRITSHDLPSDADLIIDSLTSFPFALDL